MISVVFTCLREKEKKLREIEVNSERNIYIERERARKIYREERKRGRERERKREKERQQHYLTSQRSITSKITFKSHSSGLVAVTQYEWMEQNWIITGIFQGTVGRRAVLGM